MNSYVEIRVDGWRVSQRHRRPWPSGAEDIGTWEHIIELLSWIAVVINGPSTLAASPGMQRPTVGWTPTRVGLILTFTGSILTNRTVAARSPRGGRDARFPSTCDRASVPFERSQSGERRAEESRRSAVRGTLRLAIEGIVVFIGFLHGLLLVKVLISLSIPEVPPDVAIQIDRPNQRGTQPVCRFGALVWSRRPTFETRSLRRIDVVSAASWTTAPLGSRSPSLD